MSYDRATLAAALARRAGQTITPELAREILNDACAAPDRSIDPAIIAPMPCGTLTFQIERFADCMAALHGLHVKHWAETEGHRNDLPLKMDYPALLEEARAGTLVQFTARCGPQIVGNFRLYLRTSRHNGAKLAVEDTLYILPEHRRGRAALRFLQYAKVALTGLGYYEFRATTKHSNPAAGRLLESQGFKPVATEYVLILKEPNHVR